MIVILSVGLIVGGLIVFLITENQVTLLKQDQAEIASTTVPDDWNVYRDQFITFAYPSYYHSPNLDSRGGGLWLQDRYAHALDPRPNSSTDGIPDIDIVFSDTGGSIDDFIQTRFGLPSDYADHSDRNYSSVENVLINGKKFTTIMVADMLTTVGYYYEDRGFITGFEIYFFTESKDEQLRQILGTLEYTF